MLWQEGIGQSANVGQSSVLRAERSCVGYAEIRNEKRESRNV